VYAKHVYVCDPVDMYSLALFKFKNRPGWHGDVALNTAFPCFIYRRLPWETWQSAAFRSASPWSLPPLGRPIHESSSIMDGRFMHMLLDCVGAAPYSIALCCVRVSVQTRSDIFAVFLWSADQVRSDPTRTIERQPISPSWVVYLWSVIDFTACFGERASSASIMSLESSMKRAPLHTRPTPLYPRFMVDPNCFGVIIHRESIRWNNCAIDSRFQHAKYVSVCVVSLTRAVISQSWNFVLTR
jgi:hypothetical protein